MGRKDPNSKKLFRKSNNIRRTDGNYKSQGRGKSQQKNYGKGDKRYQPYHSDKKSWKKGQKLFQQV